jgi:hypothetical protein
VLARPHTTCTNTSPQTELARPSQPSTCDIGSSTTCSGMKTPNSISAKTSSLPGKRHLLST